MAGCAVPRCPCSPAGSIGEYNVAVLISALQEGNTGMLLPVPHGLPEDCPLAACQDEEARLWHHPGHPPPPTAQESPPERQKVPLIPPGTAGLTCEVSPNDEGDDPIRPHTLRSGRCRPPAPGPASPPPWASPLRLPTGVLAAGDRGVSWNRKTKSSEAGERREEWETIMIALLLGGGPVYPLIAIYL